MLLGQEDLKQLVTLGKNFGKSLSSALEKGQKSQITCHQDSITTNDDSKKQCFLHILLLFVHTYTYMCVCVCVCLCLCLCVCVCIVESGGSSEVREAIMEGLMTADEEESKTEGKMREEEEQEEEGKELEKVTDMVKVTSSLNYFELKLFKEEPTLVSNNHFIASSPHPH